MALILFHLSVASFGTSLIWYDQNYQDFTLYGNAQDVVPFKGRISFITVWGCALYIVFFYAAIINDIWGSSARKPMQNHIRKAKDFLFSLAFGFAFFVTSLFWILYEIDPELILPREIEDQFPPGLNHAMHSIAIPLLLIELAVADVSFPPRKYYYISLLIIGVAYVFCVHLIHFIHGIWVYPYLVDLYFAYNLLCFAAIITYGLLVCFICEKVIVYVNRRKNVSKSS